MSEEKGPLAEPSVMEQFKAALASEAVEPVVEKPRVLVLLATIPARRHLCDQLLKMLGQQTMQPDGVIFVLDGYGDQLAPTCPLPVFKEYRTKELSGPGNRWRVAADLAPEDILICLDDDTMLHEAPNLIRGLFKELESGYSAAAAMGRDVEGKYSGPGRTSRGDLVYAAGNGFATRAKNLIGLQAFAKEILAKGGPDALGSLGDDDALVSAFLWKNGVKIRHAKTGNIVSAPGSQSTSQTAARRIKQGNLEAQKIEIQKLTGWPCFLKIPTFIKPRPGQIPAVGRNSGLPTWPARQGR